MRLRISPIICASFVGVLWNDSGLNYRLSALRIVIFLFVAFTCGSISTVDNAASDRKYSRIISLSDSDFDKLFSVSSVQCRTVGALNLLRAAWIVSSCFKADVSCSRARPVSASKASSSSASVRSPGARTLSPRVS